MKNLKKVAAVLAAAMAMNAVAVTGAFSASAADDAGHHRKRFSEGTDGRLSVLGRR